VSVPVECLSKYTVDRREDSSIHSGCTLAFQVFTSTHRALRGDHMGDQFFTSSGQLTTHIAVP